MTRCLTPESAEELVPFLEAGMRGLERARWKIGDPAAELVAPIVLTVIAEVARRLPLDEMGEALTAARRTPDCTGCQDSPPPGYLCTACKRTTPAVIKTLGTQP